LGKRLSRQRTESVRSAQIERLGSAQQLDRDDPMAQCGLLGDAARGQRGMVIRSLVKGEAVAVDLHRHGAERYPVPRAWVLGAEVPTT
jgi:hypothetical protein